MELVALIAIFVGLFAGTGLGFLFVVNDRWFVRDTIEEVEEIISKKGKLPYTNDDDANYNFAYLVGANDILNIFRGKR